MAFHAMSTVAFSTVFSAPIYEICIITYTDSYLLGETLAIIPRYLQVIEMVVVQEQQNVRPILRSLTMRVACRSFLF